MVRDFGTVAGLLGRGDQPRTPNGNLSVVAVLRRADQDSSNADETNPLSRAERLRLATPILNDLLQHDASGVDQSDT